MSPSTNHIIRLIPTYWVQCWTCYSNIFLSSLVSSIFLSIKLTSGNCEGRRSHTALFLSKDKYKMPPYSLREPADPLTTGLTHSDHIILLVCTTHALVHLLTHFFPHIYRPVSDGFASLKSEVSICLNYETLYSPTITSWINKLDIKM